MSKNPMEWIEIYVDDIERAKSFYEKVFGFTLDKMESPDPEMQMYSFPMKIDGPNATGALVKSKYNKPSPNGTIPYFSSDDCDIEMAKATEAGSTIKSPKIQAGDWGYYCIFTDSEGNNIGCFSQK